MQKGNYQGNTHPSQMGFAIEMCLGSTESRRPHSCHHATQAYNAQESVEPEGNSSEVIKH